MLSPTLAGCACWISPSWPFWMVIHFNAFYTLEVLSEWNRLQESLHPNPMGSEECSIRSLWVLGSFESSMSNDHAWPCRLDMSNVCVIFRWKLMWTKITANSSRTGRSVCHVSWFASWITKTRGEFDLFVSLLYIAATTSSKSNSRNFPFLSASAFLRTMTARPGSQDISAGIWTKMNWMRITSSISLWAMGLCLGGSRRVLEG